MATSSKNRLKKAACPATSVFKCRSEIKQGLVSVILSVFASMQGQEKRDIDDGINQKYNGNILTEAQKKPPER